MDGQSRTVEQKLAEFGREAWGVVTRAQLLSAGVSDEEIYHRLHIGSLIAQFRGVYRVGHTAPSTEATYMAAVKACGEGAVLSSLAAAHLYGLLKGPPPPPYVTTRTQRRIASINTRRARAGVDPRDVSDWRGIPITTIPRTLIDISSLLALDDLAFACHQAEVRYKVNAPRVEAALARYPNAPGSRKLRSVIRGDHHVTLSELEKRFLALLREHNLPLPQTNRRVGGHWVDCRWPEHKLTVELDSYRFHNTRHSWKQSYRRERKARRRGDDWHRFTWDDVTKTPDATIAELAPLLT